MELSRPTTSSRLCTILTNSQISVVLSLVAPLSHARVSCATKASSSCSSARHPVGRNRRSRCIPRRSERKPRPKDISGLRCLRRASPEGKTKPRRLQRATRPSRFILYLVTLSAVRALCECCAVCAFCTCRHPFSPPLEIARTTSRRNTRNARNARAQAPSTAHCV